MMKVTMAHDYQCLRSRLILLSVSTLVLLAVVVDAQFFLQRPIRPLFFVHKSITQNNNNNNGPLSFNRGPQASGEPLQGQQQQLQVQEPQTQSDEDTRRGPSFRGNARSDLLTSSEEENENESSNTSVEEQEERRPQGRHNLGGRRRNATQQLPLNFDDATIRANRPPLEPRPHPPRRGDPAVMEMEDEEQDRSRFLWPFQTSVTVSKTKAHPHHHHPPHHHHHLSYHDYVEQMHNAGQGVGDGWSHEEEAYTKPLTDEEILHSKGSSEEEEEAEEEEDEEEASDSPTPPQTRSSFPVKQQQQQHAPQEGQNQKLKSPSSLSSLLRLPSIPMPSLPSLPSLPSFGLDKGANLLNRLRPSALLTKSQDTKIIHRPQPYVDHRRPLINSNSNDVHFVPSPHNNRRNSFRTEDLHGTNNKNKGNTNKNNKQVTTNTNKNRRTKVKTKVQKKEKVKKTIYNILMTTMNALDRSKDEEEEEDEDLKLRR